ncbi:tetratricopeptide repeat protein [Oculatella sp. LEGE 06141]|uniref:tetratricopeptide repeat protein n=1 Tax=Oculatella sp. LEGE 06141 TaxID=1828648 RepID=UPI0018823F2D
MKYQDLFDQKRYEEAIVELQKELKLEADDRKLSLLALCKFIVGDYENALMTLKKIEYPQQVDYEIWADIHWLYKNWDEMIAALRAAQQFSPSAYTYYRLAVAEVRGRYLHQIDAASKEIIKNYLLKAVEFDDCSPDAFLLLFRLQESEDLGDKLNTLNKAFQRHPDNPNIRYELASILIYQEREYERATTLLSPLLGTKEFGQKSKWCIFETLWRQGSYVDAIKYLDNLNIKDKKFISRVKADLLFKQNKLSEWLVLTAESANNDDIESVIRYHFTKAYVNLQKNNLEQAINDFKAGALLFLGQDIYLENFVESWTEGSFFAYQDFDVIYEICETLVLLKDETEVITSQVSGLLLYIIQKHFSGKQHDELLQFFSIQSETPLLLSAKLLDFPPSLGNELAREFLDRDFLEAIRFYLDYAIWKCESDEYILEEFEAKLYNEEGDGENEITIRQGPLIEEIVLSRLEKCTNSKVIIEVFLPFYDAFWRDLLFKLKSFKVVAKVSQKFMVASERSHGIFDYAYSSNCIGNTDEAEAAYKSLIDQQPNNAAAINNLGVIYERKGLLDEAFSLFGQAVEIHEDDEIHNSNYRRLKSLIELRNDSLQRFQISLDKVVEKAVRVGLSEEALADLNELYWYSDLSTSSIQERLDLKRYSSSNLYNFVFPYRTEEKCPNCFIDLTYKSRSAKASDDKICLGCGHKNRGWCSCQYCKNIQEERRRKAERERYQAALEEFNKTKEQYCTNEYAEWAIAKLSRREKIFLKAFIEVIQESENPTWEEICEKAGVVSHKIYASKLKNLKLLLVNPEGQILRNSAVKLDMLEVENVRRISPSIRFDVFQRDNHVCQYCGRTPPEVKLVVDHLVPVAQGGTDVFENLVTSCEECNSGKSDKLIKAFTGGFDKEDWSKHIRDTRLNVLQERREKIDEVKRFWVALLKKRRLPERDDTAIHIFIEKYEPEWIKSAITIAVNKEIKDYIKYTAGILRNWAKDGPPENLSNPDIGLTKNLATPKQIAYIKALLERVGLSLGDLVDKTDFDELTMLDARNLISELTEEASE